MPEYVELNSTARSGLIIEPDVWHELTADLMNLAELIGLKYRF